MGRRQLTLHEHCKGSHFTRDERLKMPRRLRPAHRRKDTALFCGYRLPP
jgi:hypothetical protein